MVGMPYNHLVKLSLVASHSSDSSFGAPSACGSKKLQNDTKEVCHLTIVGRIPGFQINAKRSSNLVLKVGANLNMERVSLT